jgi:hypothetical protein
MSFNAVLETRSYSEAGVVDNSHPPIVMAMEAVADQGELAPGLIASKNAAEKVVPFDRFAESIGTGDNTAVDFSGTLSSPPVKPGSVEVTDGTETFTDDECGNLNGDAGGSGTVNYVTGEISVSFNAAPATDADISASYANRVAGVVTMRVDTANEDAAPVLVHGTVAVNKLSRNGTDPSDADLSALAEAGIYPR